MKVAAGGVGCVVVVEATAGAAAGVEGAVVVVVVDDIAGEAAVAAEEGVAVVGCIGVPGVGAPTVQCQGRYCHSQSRWSRGCFDALVVGGPGTTRGRAEMVAGTQGSVDSGE